MNLKEINVNMMNLINLTKDRDYWRALVYAELNLHVSKAMELVIKLKYWFIILTYIL